MSSSSTAPHQDTLEERRRGWMIRWEDDRVEWKAFNDESGRRKEQWGSKGGKCLKDAVIMTSLLDHASSVKDQLSPFLSLTTVRGDAGCCAEVRAFTWSPSILVGLQNKSDGALLSCTTAG